MFKIIKWGIGIVLLLVIIGGWWLVSNVNSLGKVAVEKGSTYALGVDTKLGGLNLSLLGGSVELTEMNIANPQGFKAANIMTLGKGQVAISIPSLLSDTIEVPLFELKNLALNIEQSGIGKTNFDQLLENLKKVQGDAPAEQTGSSKKLKIKKLLITDTTANIQLLPIGGVPSTIPVKIPRIEIDDFDPENGKGVVIAEIFQIIIPTVIAAVLEGGKNLIPTDLANSLGKGVAGVVGQIGGEAGKIMSGVGTKLGPAFKDTLGGAGGLLEKGVKDIGKGVGDVGKGIGEGLKDVGKGVEEGIKDVGKGVEGLFNKPKDEKK